MTRGFHKLALLLEHLPYTFDRSHVSDGRSHSMDCRIQWVAEASAPDMHCAHGIPIGPRNMYAGLVAHSLLTQVT